MHTTDPGQHSSELFPAHRGFGPLLQRDYWAVIDGCRLRPSELVSAIARAFEAFAPEELVVFRRAGRPGLPLQPGARLDVRIAGAGQTRVEVIHADAQSFTLATVRGHPEAGRITFGAYRNERGDVVFHIRSRARSSSPLKYLGFVGAGEPMQTRTWTGFVNRVARSAGRGVLGWIHAETCRCADEPLEKALGRPTFLARGD